MLEFTNEIKPKFPPKVQQIWDDCGTHVVSMEAEQGAKEIEFFVEKMFEKLVKEFDSKQCYSNLTFQGFIVKKGYL